MNEVKIKVDDKTKTLRFGERLTTGSRYRVVVEGGAETCGAAGSLVLMDRGTLVAFAELADGAGEISTNTREMAEALKGMPIGVTVEFDVVLHKKDDAEGENVAIGICRVLSAGGAWTDDTTGALALYKGERGEVGAAGESAYEVARRNGFEGTEEEWLASLKAEADMTVAEAVEQTKAYADGIKKSLAQMQYVKCDEESTEEKPVYHKVTVKKNALGQPVLTVDSTPSSIEGGDPETSRYVYTDTAQEITGKKTFAGAVELGAEATATIQDTEDESAKVATTGWVAKWWEKVKAVLLGAANTWTGKNTFKTDVSVEGAGITADSITAGTASLSGDATLNGAMTVAGDATLNGAMTVAKDATLNGAMTVAGDATLNGAMTVAGDATLNGATTVANMNAPSFAWDGFENDDKARGISAEYLWLLMGRFAAYFGGNYYVAQLENVYFGNGKEWRQHDRQTGYFNWRAKTVANEAFRGATQLYNIFLPNVTTVGDYAFYGCTNLRSGANGETRYNFLKVKSVGKYAFYNCDSLGTVLNDATFPLLEAAGQCAFDHCSNVTQVYLPLLRRCDYQAFHELGAVTEIKVSESVPDDQLGDAEVFEKAVLSIDTSAWNAVSASMSTLYSALCSAVGQDIYDVYTTWNGYVYNDGSLVTFSAPKIQLFCDYSVYNAQNLANIDISNALFIGAAAFSQIRYNNTSAARIQQLNIPNCRAICWCAFGSETNNYWACPMNVVRADNLLVVAHSAFYMDYSIQSFYAPRLKTICTNAFWGCVNLTSSSYTDENGVVQGRTDAVEFPEATYVGESAFNGRGSHMAMKKLYLPKATFIGSNAFSDTPNLTDLYLYSLNANSVIQAGSIGNWGLSTTAYSGTMASHTGVAVHMVNDVGAKVIVGYQEGWKVIGNEE